MNGATMTEVRTVPPIGEIIRGVLRDTGYGSYATMPVIDQIADALGDRERALYGAGFSSGQPVTDEILRRLEENEDPRSVAQDVLATADTPADPAAYLPEQTKGQRLRALENQMADLATQVQNLTAFARDNG